MARRWFGNRRADRETEGRIRVAKIVGRKYRFVDDYKKTVYVGANGKSKDRVTYIGKWVWLQNDDEAYSRIVLFCRIAIGVAVAALIGSVFILGNTTGGKWYMPVAVLTVFPLAYAIMGAVAMPGRKKPMERKKFNDSFERTKIAAYLTLIFLGLSALTWLICWILTWNGVKVVQSEFSWQDAGFLVCLVLSAAASLVIIRKIKEIKTELRDNASYKPE